MAGAILQAMRAVALQVMPATVRTAMRSRQLCAALLLGVLGCAQGAAPIEIHLEIDMTEALADGRFRPDQGDHVGLRGGWPPLQWHQPLMLTRRDGNRWAITVRLAHAPAGGQPIPHKLRIERSGQGQEAGWEEGANRLMPSHPMGGVWHRRFNAPPEAPAVERAGDIEHLGLVPSAHVDARRVQVWLPPGYHTQPQRRWPVLYLHDGQNVFDAQAAGSEWRVDETAQRLALAGQIDTPLIVAIDSTGQRVHDYTPTEQAPQPTAGERTRRVGGGAPAYGRFLLDELKPLIDARYRTRPEAAATAVGGASLGGLVSLWLALEHPQRVGAALVVSPSLWWGHGWALRRVQAGAAQGASPGPRLWLDIGLHEGAQALAQTRELRAALRAQGWSDKALAYTEDPLGTHSELAWAGRVEAMLRFLYGRAAPSPEGAVVSSCFLSHPAAAEPSRMPPSSAWRTHHAQLLRRPDDRDRTGPSPPVRRVRRALAG